MSTWLSELGASFAETVFSGPVLAAIPLAVLAGLISFASPCVLPLVPGYLGYIGGMAGSTAVGGPHTSSVRASAREGAVRTAPPQVDVQRARLILGVVLFIAGFTLVFVLVVVALSSVGLWLARWQDLITRALGVVVILLGLAFMGLIPALQRQRRVRITPTGGLWGAPVLGVSFGLGWSPCIGPTLAAVLALAPASPARAGVLVVAYCLGLGVPFFLAALGLRSSQRMIDALRRHRVLIMRAGGGLLVAIGMAQVTGLWTRLAYWLQGYVADFQTLL